MILFWYFLSFCLSSLDKFLCFYIFYIFPLKYFSIRYFSMFIPCLFLQPFYYFHFFFFFFAFLPPFLILCLFFQSLFISLIKCVVIIHVLCIDKKKFNFYIFTIIPSFLLNQNLPKMNSKILKFFCWQIVWFTMSMIDHFVGLALKGLTSIPPDTSILAYSSSYMLFSMRSK